MGGNIQKGKAPSDQQNNKKTSNPQLLPDVSENELKEKAYLGNYRWFYSPYFKNWERYNFLTKEQKEKVIWMIFPLEKSYEIERQYINRYPYERDNQLIFFDNLQQKHMLIGNKDGEMEYLGIVKRDQPSNIKYIKNLTRFETFNLLNYFDNECNSYEYILLNNLGIVGYEKIFNFFQFNPQDKIVAKFLTTNIICNQKFSQFLNNEYQEYLKTNFLNIKQFLLL